jgi:hypothetical protein
VTGGVEVGHRMRLCGFGSLPRGDESSALCSDLSRADQAVAQRGHRRTRLVSPMSLILKTQEHVPNFERAGARRASNIKVAGRHYDRADPPRWLKLLEIGSSPASTLSAPPNSRPNSTRCCSRPSRRSPVSSASRTTAATAQSDHRRQQRSPPRPAGTSTSDAAD